MAGWGGPSLSEVAKLRAENERLRAKLAQAEVIIEVQGKVHAPGGHLGERGARRRMTASSTPASTNSPPAACPANELAESWAAPAGHYRRRRPPLYGPPAPRPCSHRALTFDEETEILGTLNSERFCDRALAQIWATLLDEGTYLGSVSTMYRLLRAQHQVRERRAQARRPPTIKPESVATAPNRVVLDITKLRGPPQVVLVPALRDPRRLLPLRRGLAGRSPRVRPNAVEELIADAIYAHSGLRRAALPHADRGSSMTSKTNQLLADLGVTQSHSRPHQSNDNPLQRSPVQDLKYCPTFPKRFTGIDHAWRVLRHVLRSLQLPAPPLRHRAPHPRRRPPRPRHRHPQRSAVVLDAAYTARPERFRRRPNAPPDPRGNMDQPNPRAAPRHRSHSNHRCLTFKTRSAGAQTVTPLRILGP